MIKNIKYLFLILFLTNCTFFTPYGRDYKRAQNEYSTKNYDKSIEYCINSLKEKPDFKKSLEMYERLVPIAIEFHHSNINKYLNDPNNQKKLVQNFEKLFDLIEKIEKASISDSYKLYVTDYSAEYEKVRENLADSHYRKGLEFMSYDDKKNYKLAYNEFILSNYYKKNYKESKKHIEKCKNNSIFHITIMDFENNSNNQYDNIGKSISNKLVSDLYNISSFNETVDIIDRKNMETIIEQLKISESGLINDTKIELGEIKEIDHIIRGEINKIIIDEPEHTYEKIKIINNDGTRKYKKKYTVEAFVLIEIYLEIIDVETAEIINSKTLSSEVSYVDKWTTSSVNTGNLLLDLGLTIFTGAISQDIYERKDISSDEILSQATNEINEKMKNYLTDFYK